jgi:hypothetical protein
VLAFLSGMGVYHAVVLPSVFVVGPVIAQTEMNGAESWALITAGVGVGVGVAVVVALLPSVRGLPRGTA